MKAVYLDSAKDLQKLGLGDEQSCLIKRKELCSHEGMREPVHAMLVAGIMYSWLSYIWSTHLDQRSNPSI